MSRIKLAEFPEILSDQVKIAAQATLSFWASQLRKGDTPVSKDSLFLCKRISDFLDKASEDLVREIASMSTNVFVVDPDVKIDQENDIHELLTLYEESCQIPDLCPNSLLMDKIQTCQQSIRIRCVAHCTLDF